MLVIYNHWPRYAKNVSIQTSIIMCKRSIGQGAKTSVPKIKICKTLVAKRGALTW
jgi:hypothetical protein